MDNYHNVMETLVVNKLNEVWDTLDCCKCDKCRNDIIACTFHEFEIIKAIAASLRIVTEHPKHYI